MNASDIIICQKCGSQNPRNTKFCGECGSPLVQQEKDSVQASTVEKGSALGVVSLVAAILGFTCVPIFGLIIAIITGYLTPNARENSYAKAGTSIGVFVLSTALWFQSIFRYKYISFF
ncbi:MAG: zinc-ribbon domain-containing protein [Candidatus Heimdallarchaeota archaeon]|nr:zinc-ribbon domain-containing protein [Candidatus Heimdallarchaeota archaeon]